MRIKKTFCLSVLALSASFVFAAEPEVGVSSDDLKAVLARLEKLERENQAQALRIAELERRNAELAGPVAAVPALEAGAETNGTGRIITTAAGNRHYLADKLAGIFEPLSRNGLRITPYGNLAFEAAFANRSLDSDFATDFVRNRHSRGARHAQTTFSMQDSQLGLMFATPEELNGWLFSGKAEFDLVGASQNSYDFHWRHLYLDASHLSGWSFLFGQTWHLWKIVTPSAIDGAWMENTGHPYRRSPQLRVTKKWDFEDSTLEVRAGLVKGGPGMGSDRDHDGIQDNTASPWVLFEGALVYDRIAPWETETGRRWLVGFGGMYGRDRSHRWSGVSDSGERQFDGKDDEYDSRMALVAASVPFGDFTLTGQAYAGENLGGVQAGCGQRVAYKRIDHRGDSVSTVGGFVDLGYQLNDRWSFALGYGMDNPDDGDARAANGISFNDRAYVDAFYRLTDNFSLAFEYAHLRTRYEEIGERSANTSAAERFQISIFYHF